MLLVLSKWTENLWAQPLLQQSKNTSAKSKAAETATAPLSTHTHTHTLVLVNAMHFLPLFPWKGYGKSVLKCRNHSSERIKKKNISISNELEKTSSQMIFCGSFLLGRPFLMLSDYLLLTKCTSVISDNVLFERSRKLCQCNRWTENGNSTPLQ